MARYLPGILMRRSKVEIIWTNNFGSPNVIKFIDHLLFQLLEIFLAQFYNRDLNFHNEKFKSYLQTFSMKVEQMDTCAVFKITF